MRKRMFQLAVFSLLLGLISLPMLSAQETEGSDAYQISPMKVQLQNDLELSGTPIDLENIQISSLFGEAKLPLHTIAGIRFANAADEQATIVLQNGDVLTGELVIQKLKFISEWGEATVNISHIESIVFRSDLGWSPVSTSNGTRWRLTKVNQKTARSPSRDSNTQTIRYYRSSSR